MFETILDKFQLNFFNIFFNFYSMLSFIQLIASFVAVKIKLMHNVDIVVPKNVGANSIVDDESVAKFKAAIVAAAAAATETAPIEEESNGESNDKSVEK